MHGCLLPALKVALASIPSQVTPIMYKLCTNKFPCFPLSTLTSSDIPSCIHDDKIEIALWCVSKEISADVDISTGKVSVPNPGLKCATFYKCLHPSIWPSAQRAWEFEGAYVTCYSRLTRTVWQIDWQTMEKVWWTDCHMEIQTKESQVITLPMQLTQNFQRYALHKHKHTLQIQLT